MSVLFEKWWHNGTKCFSVRNHRKAWKEVGNEPRLTVFHNGAKKKNGDTCLDVHLIVGYTIFNYTDFDLQR